MPPAAIAVAGAAITAASLTVTGVTIGVAIAVAGAQLALGLASSYLLASKPKGSNLAGFAATAQGRTQQVRQAITARRAIVGEARVSGPGVLMASTENNKYLHSVIALATHQCEEIGTVFLDEDPIFSDDLDEDGEVVAGKYDGKVRIKKHLGATDQVADSDLVAEISEWTSSHRGRGIAYLYVRLQFDQNLFPSSAPNISAEVKGALLYDNRDAGTRYSDNAALALPYYLTELYDNGNAFGTGDFNAAQWNAAANACDEFVAVKDDVHEAPTTTPGEGTEPEGGFLDLAGDTLKFQTGDRVQLTTTGTLPGGLAEMTNYYVICVRRQATDHKALRIQLASSLANARAGVPVDIEDEGSGNFMVTKKAEPRYVACGVIDLDQDGEAVINELLTAMGGRAILAGDEWFLYPAVWTAPTITLDEGDVRGPLKVQTRISRRDRFNAVSGAYVSPLNSGQASDYPLVTASEFQNADGGRVIKKHDLPYTPRSNMAQRLASIELLRNRREISVQSKWSMAAGRLQCADTVGLDSTRYGWTDKTFEIADWSFVSEEADGAPAYFIPMSLREVDSQVFDFDSVNEEVQVGAAPRTTLPDAFNVAQPTSVRLSTKRYTTDTSTVIASILIEWSLHPDFYVQNDGHIIAQIKRADEEDWLQTWEVEGDQVKMLSPPAQDGILYDVRIRARNQLGVLSDWVTLSNFQMGSAGGGAINQFFDGHYVDDPVEMMEHDGAFVGDPVETTVNDGNYTS